MIEGEKSISFSPGAGGLENDSGSIASPNTTLNHHSPNTTLNRRALSLEATNPFDSDATTFTLANAEPVQVSSNISNSEPNFAKRQRIENHHRPMQFVKAPMDRSRSASQYNDVSGCWNNNGEGSITSPNFSVKDEFRSDNETDEITAKAMNDKIEQDLEVIIDQMIQKEEERFGDLEIEQKEMKKQTKYMAFIRQCASVVGCYIIILITGALKRTFMKKSMNADGTVGYNIWFVLMLKDTLCFVAIVAIRLFRHYLWKSRHSAEDNIYFSCFTNTTAFFVAIPGAGLVVAFEYLAFMAMARLDINTFILLMDTTIIFIVIFRGMLLFIIPDRCQFAIIITIVVGIIGFRIASSETSVYIVNFLGPGAWICISASVVGGLTAVFWEWFYHRTEIRFVSLCTLAMTMQFIITLCFCLGVNYGSYSEMSKGFSANILMLIAAQAIMNLCTHYAIAKTNAVANEMIIQVAFISITATMVAIDSKPFTTPMSISMFITFICITAYLIIDYYRNRDEQNKELRDRQDSINRQRASLLANGSSLLPAEFLKETAKAPESGCGRTSLFDDKGCDNAYTANLPSIFLANERAYNLEGILPAPTIEPIQMNAYEVNNFGRYNNIEDKTPCRSPSLRI